MSKERKFEPWKGNWRAGVVCSALALFALFLAYRTIVSMMTGMIVAAIFAAIAIHQFNSMKRRQFGKQLETRATDQACAELERAGFVLQTNRMVRGLGDIDIIASKGEKKATIEIKSFVVWTRFLIFFNGDRERKAVKQAAKQREAVDADVAVIWLPQGRASWLSMLFPYPSVGSGVRLVRGGPAKLRKALNSLL